MKKIITELDFQRNQLHNAVIGHSATEPSNPVAGQMFYDTNDNRAKIYDGGTDDFKKIIIDEDFNISNISGFDLSSLVEGDILLYQSYGSFGNKKMSGDAKVNSSGAVTIQPGAIGYSKINNTDIEIDLSLSASNTKLARADAIKAYIDNALVTDKHYVLEGILDCSANPSYPAADASSTYVVSVAGKIGGDQGVDVLRGYLLLCTDNNTSSGDQDTVGSSWVIIKSSMGDTDDESLFMEKSAYDTNLNGKVDVAEVAESVDEDNVVGLDKYTQVEVTNLIAALETSLKGGVTTDGDTLGKLLTKIEAIQTLIASDNVNLDSVQELVDAIEDVQTYIDTVLVNDLTTGGVSKALTAEMGKTLKGLIDGLTTVVDGKEPTITKNSAFNKEFGTGLGQVAQGNHNHSGVYEPIITKNTAFNKNFGVNSGEVAEGNHTHSAQSIQKFTGQAITAENISTLKGIIGLSQDTVDFTEDKVFGNLDQQKVAFGPFKGSNVSSDQLKLLMKKTGTPSNFEIRIETDAAGIPSGTLADVNAYGSLTEASFTTSLAIVTITLNSAIQIDGDSFWIVLGQTTNSNTDYYTVGSKVSSMHTYMQYNGTDWGLFGNTVVDTIQTGSSTTYNTKQLEYYFTPSSNIILEKIQCWNASYPFSSLDLYAASDMATVLASAAISGVDHTFNYELQSGVQYVLKGPTTYYQYYQSIGALPKVKTNLTLDNMKLGASNTTTTYCLKSFHTKVLNVGGSETKETYYGGSIFEKDKLVKIAKATDSNISGIKGISQETVNKFLDIEFAYEGIISGFSNLTVSNNIGDPVYLQDDGSFGLTAGTNTVVVGTIYSDTEVELISRISGESSATATTGAVVLGNAEGYITINIPGIGNKKIPYYGI